MSRATRARKPQQLPKGRHPLTREAVASSQRTRLLEAMAEAVASKGYAETVVADVVERAWVSRKTFYAMFPDKEACFLAAYDEGREFLRQRIGDALKDLPPAAWRRRARASVEAYLAALAERPAGAWAFSIEVFGAGPKALARHSDVIGSWVTQWWRLGAVARGKSTPSNRTEEMRLRAMVGGIEELVRECLRARGAARLPELAPFISDIALSTLAE